MSNELDQSKPRQVKISDPDEEPKTYINFYCCKLSLNIIYTICYVTAAVALNIVNRIVFYTYNFNNYNFTFMLLQQLFCIIFFLRDIIYGEYNSNIRWYSNDNKCLNVSDFEKISSC